jgi:phosphatidylglycerophosphate synthase
MAKKKSSKATTPKLPRAADVTPQTFDPVLLVLGEDKLHLFGKSLADRSRLQFAKAGLTRVVSLADARAHHGPIVFVRSDVVIDQPLIMALLKRPRFLLLSSDTDTPEVVAGNIRATDLSALETALTEGKVPALPGLLARAPAELDMSFWQALRKKETPYALIVKDGNRADVAWRVFMGTYKGATDIVTKHVWPVPAFFATQYLSARNVTPNMVTAVAAAMTIAAFVLFWNGSFVLGLLAAWSMTFLDTVDGKLARTTLTSSKWGDVFDHGIDLVHPPFWYVAWALGLSAWGLPLGGEAFWWTIGIIVSGYVLQRLMEGVSIKWLGLEIHIWRKIDTLFRQITARRNPNLILLTVSMFVGRPDWGLTAVAAWTAACLLLHGIQLLQGLSARKSSGGALISWMAR